MNKCPVCGYSPDSKIDYRTAISNLLEKRPSHISKLLKKTINFVIKYIPSERDNKKVYEFLQSISEIDDRNVQFSLKQYLNTKYYLEQKGLSYLKAIIINIGKDSKIKKKMERKKYGSIPKERIL
ncbi:MAG: hypothetical protein H8E98_05720 [Bacteroidetes bacterium]|nr:hypothetical protein [Bacteroidota bacterium]